MSEDFAWASQIQWVSAYPGHTLFVCSVRNCLGSTVSEHTTLDVHPPSLASWASSQKGAESLRELQLARKSSESQKGAEWSEGLQAARMTLYGQEALGSRKDAE